MWQVLRRELHPRGLEIVAVALDADPEAARPYVEAAAPDFPALIDRSHVVGELFGIVNVPSSVWIDERGTIVRGVETAAVPRGLLGTRPADPRSFPAEMAEVARGIRRDPKAYVAALRDWVERGADSEWALSPDEVIARSTPRSADSARAAAEFELGEHLHRAGHVEAAQRHWRAAHRLAPDNWTYKRQAWELVDPDGQRRTKVYDSSWVEDVARIGAENYYPPLRR